MDVQILFTEPIAVQKMVQKGNYTIGTLARRTRFVN